MPDTLPTLSYEEALAKIVELQTELAEANEAVARLRSSADDNYNRGREWKDQADKLTAQVKDLVQKLDVANGAAYAAREEACELRGYIRRVNEMDPRPLRKAKSKAAEQAKIERMMRRGY